MGPPDGRVKPCVIKDRDVQAAEQSRRGGLSFGARTPDVIRWTESVSHITMTVSAGRRLGPYEIVSALLRLFDFAEGVEARLVHDGASPLPHADHRPEGVDTHEAHDDTDTEAETVHGAYSFSTSHPETAAASTSCPRPRWPSRS